MADESPNSPRLNQQDTDICEGCKKPAPLGKSGLYFCARCRRAWMPARKRA